MHFFSVFFISVKQILKFRCGASCFNFLQQRYLWREELHQEVIAIILFLVSVYTVSWFLFIWWAKKNNPGSQIECFINASVLISRVSNTMGKQIKIRSLLGYAITAVDEKGKMSFSESPRCLTITRWRSRTKVFIPGRKVHSC